MFKVIWLLRRKQGLSHEEFQDRFERVIAPLVTEQVGHLLLEYRRSYVDLALGRIGLDDDGRSIYGQREWEWDLISEWVLEDAAAFHQLQQVMTGDPKMEFIRRADTCVDRESQVMIPCSVADIRADKIVNSELSERSHAR